VVVASGIPSSGKGAALNTSSSGSTISTISQRVGNSAPEPLDHHDVVAAAEAWVDLDLLARGAEAVRSPPLGDLVGIGPGTEDGVAWGVEDPLDGHAGVTLAGALIGQRVLLF